jgi:alpha-1,3-rhamnosyl/mannosyltransferase
MRIGVEISALTPKPTGTSRYIECLLEQLGQTTHFVETFTPFSSDDHLKPSNHYGSFRRHWFRTFRLGSAMHAAGVDCGIFPNYLMPRGFGKPAAVVIHDLSFLSHPQFYSKKFAWYYTRQLRHTLSQRPLVITLSEFSKHQIQQYLGVPEDRVLLLQAYARLKPNGAVPQVRPNKRPYFLYVGHIEPRKNLRLLLEGFEEWNASRGRRFSLCIVGDVWIRSREIRRLIRSYSDHPDIRWLGRVGDEELQAWYVHALGLVHTSYVEGFGFPVLEAMHYNLPIMCSAGTAMEELVRGEGVKVDPSSRSAISGGFERLARLADERRRIRYAIPYSESRMQQQLDGILERLTPNRRGSTVLAQAESLLQAVEKTLLYARLFDAGIPPDDLHRVLHDVPASNADLRTVVDRLVREGKVGHQGEQLVLNHNVKPLFSYSNGRGVNETLRNRILSVLKRMPAISLLALSGASAHRKSTETDDIDLFVVTRTHTVYVVYFVIHLLSLLFRLRRTVCINFLVDESSMGFEGMQDFFTAHQLISLVPVSDNGMYERLMIKNSWIREFFPNVSIVSEPPGHRASIGWIWAPANYLLYAGYRLLWRERIRRANPGSLLLTPHVIKLHTNDHRPRVLAAFEQALTEYRETQRKRKSA